MSSSCRAIISSCRCIYRNLAFEHALYSTADWSTHRAMLLWSNSRSIVIGRHQNVWTEANVKFAEETGVNIARRYSGGGTVYHDSNNVNISFLTSKAQHDRKANLRFVQKVMRDSFDIALDIGERDELYLGGTRTKVSGTAAKLARNRAYHHHTLLVDVDRPIMKQVLRPSIDVTVTTSNATPSIRSSVGSLRDVNVDISTKDVIHALADAYAELNTGCPIVHASHHTHQLDDGMREAFSTSLEELMSWQWVYGWTPKFRTKIVHDGRSTWVTVEKGLIRQVDCDKLSTFIGQRFDPTLTNLDI